jgi:hypothetical protein
MEDPSEGRGWEDAEAAGIELGMVAMRRDGFILALEAVSEVDGHGPLSHIGLLVDESEAEALRHRAPVCGCELVPDRPGLLIFDDPYGVRWEVTSSSELRSTGAATGRWLHLQSS